MFFFSKIGGPTISKSSLLARLSGNQNIGEMPMYYSDNNYMIVKFRTDSSVQMPGFTFEWNTGKIMLQLQHNASLNNLVFNCFGTLLLCAVVCLVSNPRLSLLCGLNPTSDNTWTVSI